MMEAATFINAMQEDVFLERQTVDQVAPAFNEIYKELNLLTEEAKKAFTKERALTKKRDPEGVVAISEPDSSNR